MNGKVEARPSNIDSMACAIKALRRQALSSKLEMFGNRWHHLKHGGFLTLPRGNLGPSLLNSFTFSLTGMQKSSSKRDSEINVPLQYVSTPS